jgi:GTP-binding protein
LLDAEECAQIETEVVAALNWEGRVYRISAVSGQGTRKLAGDIMSRLEEINQDAVDETQADEPYSPI